MENIISAMPGSRLEQTGSSNVTTNLQRNNCSRLISFTVCSGCHISSPLVVYSKRLLLQTPIQMSTSLSDNLIKIFFINCFLFELNDLHSSRLFDFFYFQSPLNFQICYAASRFFIYVKCIYQYNYHGAEFLVI